MTTFFMDRFACVETFPNQQLRKCFDGSFEWDDGDGIFAMYFDAAGNYLYQVQEGPEGPETFEKAGVEPLTAEQMAQAVS